MEYGKKWEEVERVLGGSESWERKKDKEEEGVIGGKEREEERGRKIQNFE